MNEPPFSVAVIDPPWPYQKTSKEKAPSGTGARKLTGYSDEQYLNHSMSIPELAALPIGDLVRNHIFLWTTGPFIKAAYDLIAAWGFEPVTFVPWIKCAEINAGTKPAFTPDSTKPKFKPVYGVGYWFRGCVEPIIVAKRHGAPSVRTTWVGLLSESAGHTRKPHTLYELIENDKGRAKKKDGSFYPYFESPFLNVFGRESRTGWTVIGNEVDGQKDGLDIREAIADLLGWPRPIVKKPWITQSEPWDE